MAATRFGSVLDDTPLSVFEPIVERLRRSRGRKVIPLHQGKTVFTTPMELRNWGAEEFDLPPHHDGPTCGTDTLVAAIREKLEDRLGEAVDPARIQVTCGITHALSIVWHCVLRPGDEVLVLSPQWLFVNGLVRVAQGVPVEVPFFPTAPGRSVGDLSARLVPHITPRTRAIYFNSPNNPTGGSLSRARTEELLALAREHGLWLVSDNAYEYYDYSADGFVDPAALPGGGESTFAAYSFSKSYGLTGYRIGYLLSPPSVAERARKFGLYSIYSVPTCSQFVALSALRSGPGVLDGHRRFIREALDLTLAELRVPATRPEGGFYTFLDLSGWGGGVDDFIGRCIAEGVSLAPGHAFGERYRSHARLCYSVVGHPDLTEGIRIVNEVFERGSRTATAAGRRSGSSSSRRAPPAS